MEKLKPAYEAKGYTGRKLGEKTGIHPSDISRFVKGRANPVPKDFQKIYIELGCAPEDIAMPGEFDYNLPQGFICPKQKRPERRKKPAKTVCRTSAEKRGLFMAACAAAGVTMQDAIERYMDSCIKWYMETKKDGVA